MFKKTWNDLDESEQLIFINYCNKIFGKASTYLNNEPLYIDSDLKIVDNESIINLLFSYSKN